MRRISVIDCSHMLACWMLLRSDDVSSSVQRGRVCRQHLQLSRKA